MTYWVSKSLKRVREVPPKSIFFERDANSFESDNGQINSESEMFFQKLDHALSKICNLISNKSLRNLNSNQNISRVVNYFIYKQIQRNPQSNILGLTGEILNTLVEEIKNYPESRKVLFAPDEIVKLDDTNFLARVQKKAAVEYLFRDDQGVLEALDKRKLYLVSPSQASKCFILGDKHITRLGGTQNNGLSDKMSEWWLPISPQHAILSTGVEFNQPIIHLDSTGVRRLNMATWNISNSVCSNSFPLIHSITNSR